MTLASVSFSGPRSDHFVTRQGCQTVRSINIAISAARSALHVQQHARFAGDDLNHPTRSPAIARTDHRRHLSLHARRKNLTELCPHYCLSVHTRSDSHNIGVGQRQKAAGHVTDPLSTFPAWRRGQKLSRCKADMPRQDIDDIETCADFASLDQADVRLCDAGSAGQRELRHIFALACADQILTQHLSHRARGYAGADSLAFGWRWHACQIPDSATLPPISACLDRNGGDAPEALQRLR